MQKIPAEFYMAGTWFDDGDFQPCSDFVRTADEALDHAISRCWAPQSHPFVIMRFTNDENGGVWADCTEDTIAERNKWLTARGMEIIEQDRVA